MDLNQLYRNLKKLDVEKLAIKILNTKEFRVFMADLNRSQLADKGVNDDGDKLEPEYTEVTNIIKTASGSGTGAITSHVTLFDTGELHKSIFATVDEEISLSSHDSKVPELSAKYGEFLGLTEESLKKVQEKFNPVFIEKLNESILR